MLNLIELIKQGNSNALEQMMKELDPLVKKAVYKYTPMFQRYSIGDKDDIINSIRLTIWKCAKKFNSNNRGAWLNFVKISIYRDLNREYKSQAKYCQKTETYETSLDLIENEEDVDTFLYKHGLYSIYDQQYKLEEKVHRQLVFEKVYKYFKNKKKFEKFLNLLVEDPYIDNLKYIAKIIGERNVQNVYWKLKKIKKIYKKFYNEEGNLYGK